MDFTDVATHHAFNMWSDIKLKTNTQFCSAPESAASVKSDMIPESAIKKSQA